MLKSACSVNAIDGSPISTARSHVRSMEPARALDDAQRVGILDLVSRKRETPPEEVTIAYIAEDRMWADWAAGLLRRAGMGATVRLLTPGAVDLSPDHQRRQLLVVMSAEFTQSSHAMAAVRTLAGTDQLLAVLVTESQPDDR